MMICPNCKIKYDGEGGFCEECGTPLVKITYCPKCGGEKKKDEQVCAECAAKAAVKPAENTVEQEKPQEKNKKRKWLVIGGAAAAAFLLVVGIVVSVVLLLGGKDGKTYNYDTYLKDGEIYYTDYSKDKPGQLTAQLLHTTNNITDAELKNSVNTLSGLTYTNQQGNRMFYPEEIKDNGIYTIYYRDINKKRAKPILAAEDVTSYTVNAAGDGILYIKSQNDALCYSDLEEEYEICKNVEKAYVHHEQEKIIYKTADGSIFLHYRGGETQKIASDCELLNDYDAVSWNLSRVYYVKDNTVYMWTEENNNTVKVCSNDISRILSIYSTGELYFLREEEKTVSLMDYVYDDMAEYDAQLQEPEYPVYPQKPVAPKLSNYKSMELYWAAVTEYAIKLEEYFIDEHEYKYELEEYNRKHEEYEHKLYRDGLREELSGMTLPIKVYSLWYFDGTTEKLITDALASSYSVRCAYNAAKLVYTANGEADIEKINLMELTNQQAVLEFSADFSVKIHKAPKEYYAVCGDKVFRLEYENASNFNISTDGNRIGYMENVTEENTGTLCEIVFEGDELGEAEIVDTEVYSGSIAWSQNERAAYYKNAHWGTRYLFGDYYIDGRLIAENIHTAHYSGSEIYYYTNFNEETGCGTLNVWIDNGDGNTMTFELADSVCEYEVLGEGAVRYICNYDTAKCEGELYSYNNGETVRTDEEVTALVNTASSGGRNILS